MRGVVVVWMVVLVGIGAVGYVWLRDDAKAPGSGERATSAGVASEADESRSNAAHVDGADVAREPEQREGEDAPAATPDEFAEFRGEGSITLRIVDAQDDTPLADLPFIVYSERPRTHVTLRGVTDEKGEAEIRELPEDVVIFETPRRPPHANTIWATWLKARQHKPAVMRVGRGGTVRGRVVDDFGVPLEDVEVRLDARPGGETLASLQVVQAAHPEAAKRFDTRTVLATKTASDGRFTVDAILSRPAAIWIENGAMSPKREDELAIAFHWRLAYSQCRARIHEGETVEMPDVVIARSRAFAGRVLDPDGRGVGGALLTTRNERRTQLGSRAFDAPLADSRRRYIGYGPEGTDFRFDLAPWEEGFALALDESVTAADGSFELAVSQAFARAIVATPNGALAFFGLPESPPGSRTEGLEFRLRVETQLMLEATEPGGKPLTTQDERANPVEPGVVAIGKDGSETRAEVRRAGPTTFGARLDGAPEKFAKLVVSARDHHDASQDLATPPIGRPTLSFVLAPKVAHAIRFRVTFAEPSDRARLGASQLQLQALARSWSKSGTDGGGAGEENVVGHIGFAPAKTSDVELRVPAKRRWIVEVHGPFVADEGGWGPIELGAFEPDGERIEIELPRFSDAWAAAEEQQKRLKEERDRLLANPPEHGFITVRATDARSGEELSGFLSLERLARREETESPYGFRWHRDYEDKSGGGGRRWVVAPGRHDVTVELEGFRKSRPFTVDVATNATSDLGSVALEPLPDYRLLLTAAAGAAPTSRWSITVQDPDRPSGRSSLADAFWTSDASGVVVLRRDLPNRFVLFAWPSEHGPFREGFLPSRFELDRWDPATTLELALPRACRVRVLLDLSQIEPELRMGHVHARRVDGVSAADRWTAAAPSSQSAEAGRVFTLLAPPGQVEVRASGPCLTAPATTFDLADTDDPQEFTLVARPR